MLKTQKKRWVRGVKIKSLALLLLVLPLVSQGIVYRAEAYTTQGVLNAGDLVMNQISVSTSGRYVAFVTDQSTLVSSDLNNKADAFIKDTETGDVTLVSATPSGASGNGHTRGGIIISGNGRYVLFNSEASNLASTAGGLNAKNLYLRDLKYSTTSLIAVGQAPTIDNYPIGMSEDGRFIYYTSYQNGPRLYVLDRSLNVTERVDVNEAGVPGNNGYSGSSNVAQKSVSCDGRFVVIASGSTNLVPDDSNGFSDIFLIDRMNGHTVKDITLNSNGSSSSPKISCDGNYVIFQSAASNLVDSDTNSASDLFKYRINDGAIDRVSVKNDGSQYLGSPTSPDGGFWADGYDMSMDGRYVFYIYAKRGTTNNNYLTMRDTKLGTTSSVAPSGSNYYPWNPIVSYDGARVFYTASGTVAGGYSTLYKVTGHLPN